MAKDEGGFLTTLRRLSSRIGLCRGAPSCGTLFRVSAGAGGAGPAAGGKRRGMKAGGQRVQGMKQALLESLSDTPQTPAQLKAKVCGKVGANVAITTQLAMLKREKLAKSAARGQWVRA